MTKPTVHIIDDDEAVGRALTALTRSAGHEAIRRYRLRSVGIEKRITEILSQKGPLIHPH